MIDPSRRARLAVVSAGARLAVLNLECEGNTSARSGEGRFVITPRGVDKAHLTPASLVEVDLEGELPAAASTEAELHREVYRRRPDVNGVVHAHAFHVQVLSSANRLPDWQLLVEGAEMLGRVAWVGAHPPGSKALARAVGEALESARACVLDRHGAVVAARSVAEAVFLMMLLERLAALTVHGAR